jgi:shikimate kinase
MNKEKIVYLLVGLTGFGKSTLGNCILNKSGDLDKIKNGPFQTSDGASGCTHKFECAENEKIKIIDSIGFGDPEMSENIILDSLKSSLNSVDYKVNCVLFVAKQKQFTNETVKFFELIQEKVLQNKCEKNSILIVTGGENKGWVEKEKENKTLKKILGNCNNFYFEFSLKFDHYQDDYQDKLKNISKREKSIDELLDFLERKSFSKIDLSHIDSKVFNNEWKKVILPLLIQILFKYLRKTYTHTEMVKDGIELVNCASNIQTTECSIL